MYESFRTLVHDTTINDTTLLSTDYLNHFNEAVMLLDMVADMPELLDDVKAWQPKTYQEHFSDSVFAAKDLAIEAYDWSPAPYRKPFEDTVAALNQTIAAAIPRLEAAVRSAEPMRLGAIVAEEATTLRNLIDRAGAIINGNAARVAQGDVDAIFDDAPGPERVAEPADSGLPEIPEPVAIAFARATATVLYGPRVAIGRKA